MAKPNYQYEKRQRDLAKKQKQEEKRRQKLADKASADGRPPVPESPEATTPAAGDGSAVLTAPASEMPGSPAP